MSSFDTTVRSKKFDTVFKEVPTSGVLDVRGNKELRLFRLREIIDNNFDKEALLKFIARNIGDYVFSRAKMKKYYDEEEETNIGLDALAFMREHGGAGREGSGTEIGEIMLYIFLESVLKAPKIYSKIELNTTVRNHVSASDSIHLRLFDANGEGTSYEMVFGISSIVGDLGDAIEEAFSRIERIKNRVRDEIKIVDETVFDLPEDDPAALKMNELLSVAPGKEITRDSAYGLFLGYSIGLRKDRSSKEYRVLLESKMDDDLLAYLPKIQQNIERIGLKNNSFYIYVFPFDDSEADIKEIMKKVMKEGVLYD